MGADDISGSRTDTDSTSLLVLLGHGVKGGQPTWFRILQDEVSLQVAGRDGRPGGLRSLQDPHVVQVLATRGSDGGGCKAGRPCICRHVGLLFVRTHLGVLLLLLVLIAGHGQPKALDHAEVEEGGRHRGNHDHPDHCGDDGDDGARAG